MNPTEYLQLIAARDAAWERLENGDKNAEQEYRELQRQVKEAWYDHLYYEAEQTEVQK